jgi:hypothetical protein
MLSLLTSVVIIAGTYSTIAVLPALGLNVDLDWLYEKFPVEAVLGITITILPMFFKLIIFYLRENKTLTYCNLSPRLHKILIMGATICFFLSFILALLTWGLRALSILTDEAYATEEITHGEILSIDEQSISLDEGNEKQPSLNFFLSMSKTVLYSYIILAILEFAAIAFGSLSLLFFIQYITIVLLKMFTGITMFVIRLPLYLIESCYTLFTRHQTPQVENMPITQQTHHEVTTAITSPQPEQNISPEHTESRAEEEEKEEKKEEKDNKELENNETPTTYLPGLEKPVEEIKSIIKHFVSQKERTRAVAGISSWKVHPKLLRPLSLRLWRRNCQVASFSELRTSAV